MTVPIIIFGTVVISVVIAICILLLLGLCLWPLIQEYRKEKQLQKDSISFSYINYGHV